MNVLLVSDNLLFSRLVKKKLESWGHETAVETTGTDAYERIKKEPFRVVITGWDLKGMSGPQLCKRIRALNRSQYTYLIIYTSRSDKDSMMAGLEAGTDDYLTRPYNAVELKLRFANCERLLNLEDELREGAGTDAATGVVNGASFRHFFRIILAETRRAESTGTLMFVRVNRYRDIFSEYGYGPALKLMVEISKALNRSIRASDLVARLSDDEFCLLLQRTHWDLCIRVAEKVTSQMQNMSIIVNDTELRPDVSIASLNYPVEKLSADDILALPDRIPYQP
ncbi:MAG: diguanylate cyclase [Proteobacteria bacterium]|nr:diguanylate cyclase [Pseudomonadota bacterium]